ncbi:MAG: hypothetical protein V2I54_10400 [Bacteroidales bacterium]|jgi:hypothetical protein|nr:hypothetical protein [Bacteroidales bacterium]
MRRIILLIVFIIISFENFSQETKTEIIDQDKKNYEENVFAKAFEEINDSLDYRKRYDLIPEQLPDWFFPVIQKTSPAVIIGVSDPGMQWDEAKKQAELRALALYAIFNLSTVSNITDDYTNLHEGAGYALYSTKFQDFVLTKSKIVCDLSAIEVVDTFFTKYNEALVRIRINNTAQSPSAKDTLYVTGEHLQVFVERNYKKDKLEFFNFMVNCPLERDSCSFNLQYNYKQAYNGYEITSFWADQAIVFEPRTYSYRTNLNFVPDSTDSALTIFHLNKGIWNAYITGVLSNITWLSKRLSGTLKNSNDFYTLKSQGLIRTVSKNRVSFYLQEFKMTDNNLYLDLSGKTKQ